MFHNPNNPLAITSSDETPPSTIESPANNNKNEEEEETQVIKAETPESPKNDKVIDQSKNDPEEKTDESIMNQEEEPGN